MRVAALLGMSLTEYLVSHTIRQHQLWVAWLDLEWDRPSRTDHYLMQIGAIIATVMGDGKSTVKNDDLKLKFKTRRTVLPRKVKKVIPAAEKLQQATAMSKLRWAAILGVNPEDPELGPTKR